MCPPLLQGVPQLALCLSEETEHHIKAATAWSIGQIGRHTPEHAKAVAIANLLPKLLELYMDASSSEDLQAKVRAAAPQAAPIHLSRHGNTGHKNRQDFSFFFFFYH